MKTDTLAIHGGFAGDNETGVTEVPILQTVSYAYKTAQKQVVGLGQVNAAVSAVFILVNSKPIHPWRLRNE